MRAVVFAYHEIGYVCLEALLEYKVEIPCIFTHIDDPNEEIWFKRPIELAEKHSIPIYTPKNLKEGSWREFIISLTPDVIFSFYYRYMIPMDIIEIPSIGAFNMHGSLLPKFRGRAPVNWVLIKGEKKTGVTLHYMVEKPDAGDIIGQKEVEIECEDTAKTLMLKLALAAKELMKEMLPLIEKRSFKRTPQIGESSYYGGRRPEDGIINWEEEACSIYNLIRAVTHPYPGAFTYFNGRKLFIWWAKPIFGECSAPPGTIISKEPFVVSTGKNMLRLITVQLEGEKEMDGEIFAKTYDLENKILGRK